MRLFPTRSNDRFVSFSEAVLSPAAPFGGLYAPIELPVLGELNQLVGVSYAELANHLITLLEVDLDTETAANALDSYASFDDPLDPAPLRRVGDDLFVCELWHGPTRAFKDMALQPFGRILSALAAARNERYLILTATSGDTGPAALTSFANAHNIEVVCIYPHGGTSGVQELQMITQDAPNLKVIAIEGGFDDAQTALKNLLSSAEFAKKLEASGRKLSAANSVNFARILFQIFYHIKSYLELLKRGEIRAGEAIDVIVPSGNFGNALGAYYARKMTLPIGKIVISSNANNVLTDLLVTGRYDLRRRTLVQTSSPAMDILKSSNAERVIFDMFGFERTRELFESLERELFFELAPDELLRLQSVFEAAWSNGEEVQNAMFSSANRGYIIDPHTATCIKAIRLGESRKKVICSTAEWTKFAPTLLDALEQKTADDREALRRVSAHFEVPVAPVIDALFSKQATPVTPIKPNEIEAAILAFIERWS